jgi:enoyl-CoA hydratase/carnithine racemase
MSDVTRTDHDRYAVVTIDRASSRNSLTLDAARELSEVLQAAGRDESLRAVVLTGAGSAFCAGADFDMLSTLVKESPETISQRVYAVFQGLVRTILDLDVPVIAAVNGAALGAGCDLALACDCRIVAPDAYFEESWIKHGLLPGMGGLATLVPLVGLGRARSMLYRAEPVGARRAVQIGLAEACADEELLEKYVETWLKPLLDADRLALTYVKRGTRRTALRFLDDDLDFVSSRQGIRLASPEVVSRLDRMAEKLRTRKAPAEGADSAKA